MLNFFEKNEKKFLAIAAAVMLFLLYEEHFATNKLPFMYLLLIAILAYITISLDIVKGAFITLFKQRRMSEQFLMMIATFGAFALKDLPEALAVMIFYKIGEIFEEYAQGRARTEISSLAKLKPKTVRVILEDGTEKEIKLKQVKIGDRIRVLAGESIGIDGNLVNESAAIDTAALTGESEPRLYLKGQSVPSGGINQGQVIELIVNTLSRNSSITRLLNLIEDAAANKSKPENLIRRFAIYYTPIVVIAAVLLALVPVFIPSQSFSDWIERALVFLVVSCPCALVLSVPLSFFGGMGAISKKGVIVKGSVFIESLAKVKAIAFDKTGTLTKGEFKVVDILNNIVPEKELFSLAMSLEQKSTHPIAQSIVKHAKALGSSPYEISKIEEKAGFGLKAIYQGKNLAVGSKAFIEQNIGKIEGEYLQSKTQIFVSLDNKLLGVIELADEIKDSAESMLKGLKRLGIKTCLISGDKKEVALEIGNKLNLDEILYEQKPEDKLLNFKKFKDKYQIAAFVGDGLNDAPVLSSADIGIAMGDIGSASAVEASDVVVMTGNLNAITKTISLSKRIYNLALQNMYLTMLIKLAILALGALGFANIWLAIFGDVGVLILAVLNAMRSLTFK